MLSDLLARRAGKPYDALLDERVLAPLGMKETRVARNDGLVTGRMSNGRATPAWDAPVAYAGAGGIRSTLAGVITLARAMLGDAPAGIPPTLAAALQTSRATLGEASAKLGVAMAWHLRKRAHGAPLVCSTPA
jgi:CubicO group peptidase (beta-lactamase class C family)